MITPNTKQPGGFSEDACSRGGVAEAIVLLQAVQLDS